MGGTGQAPMFQPVGGMDQFPKGFQRAIGDKIHLNIEVKSVHQSPDGVTVSLRRYQDRKKGSQVTADYVVSCLPLSVLATLDVNLSPETMAAAKATPYSPSAKMGLQMKRRFWEEDDQIFGGHLYSNLPFGEFSYPSNDFFVKEGHHARLLRQRPDGGRHQHAHQRPHRARADARQQGASADPPGIRERVLHVLGEDQIQPRRVRFRRRGRRQGVGAPAVQSTARAVEQDGRPDRPRMRRGQRRRLVAARERSKADGTPSSRCTNARCTRSRVRCRSEREFVLPGFTY